MLAEEVVAPRDRFTAQQGQQASPLHHLRHRQPGQLQQRRPQVYVQRHLLQPDSPPRRVGAWIVHHQRHAHGVVVEQPAVGVAALADQEAMVGGVQDDGVVGDSQPLQLVDEAAHHAVDAADHAPIALRGTLEVVLRVPPGVPAFPALVLPQERRQCLEKSGIGSGGPRDHLVFVEAALRVRRIVVLRVAVARVRRIETHRQAERAIAGTAAQELHHAVADDLREMPVRAILLRDPVALAGGVLVVVVEHVEHPGQGRDVPRHRQLSLGVDAELADHPGVVAGVAQQPGVADVGELGAQRRLVEGEPVTPPVQPGEDAGAAGGADRRGGKGVREVGPPGRQPVHVGSLNDGIPGTAQRIPALVVGLEKKYVRRPAAHRQSP